MQHERRQKRKRPNKGETKMRSKRTKEIIRYNIGEEK
jgi:hypothetical protein